MAELHLTPPPVPVPVEEVRSLYSERVKPHRFGDRFGVQGRRSDVSAWLRQVAGQVDATGNSDDALTWVLLNWTNAEVIVATREESE